MLVFLRKNTRINTKMGGIHELFAVALFFGVRFAGATLERDPKSYPTNVFRKCLIIECFRVSELQTHNRICAAPFE